MPLESIRTYAEWAGLEKTAHWHACVGLVMEHGNYLDAAIIEFKKALEIDNMAWVAQERLSLCYARHNNSNLQLALEWMAKAIENVPANLSFLVQREFLPQVAEWLSKIGDTENTIKAWKEVWENNIHEVYHLHKYICELHKGGRHQDLVAVIMELSTLMSLNEHCKTLLVRLISSGYAEVFDAIGMSFGAINATDARITFLDACTMAITAADTIAAEKGHRVHSQIRADIAFFKYYYCDETSEAITLWQQTIDLINDFAAPGEPLPVWERTRCTNAICQNLFDTAVEAKEKGEDPAPWIDSLKDLANLGAAEPIGSKYKNPAFGAGYASMIYGVWLRSYGGAEEAVWMKFFQDVVLQNINMLVNEPPDQKIFA